MRDGAMEKAVILARGLGTRMRNSDNNNTGVRPEQDFVAKTGIKAMIPVGRPFLDYVISALADAGFKKVCLVIGPGEEFNALREYYDSIKAERVTIGYAIQERPAGTADAVAAARKFAGDDAFAVINSDNYYPPEALNILRKIDSCGTIAFERNALAERGNIPSERISKFALLEPDDEFYLKRIIEKPSEEYMSSLSGEVYISMNCWRFSRSIFEACRSIKPSVRGEYEIASAVEYAMNHLGEKFRMIPVKLGVLDMTGRSDIKSVDSILRGKEVNL
jgi:glucose-1-phosphate thymidylyltransferase